MTLELAAIPLALVAGVFGILSPCVWPLVPVVTSSAATSGRSGPVYLALGLSVSFAVAGTLLTLLLVSTGLDPELFRYVAAGLLIAVALVLLVRSLNDWAVLRLSSLSSRFNVGGHAGRVSAPGQFGVGALLGVVWLPCVGPTLGAAIALASMGQNMGMAFVVMLAYGIGTAGVLLLAGVLSGRLLSRWRSTLISSGGFGKKLLGWTLLTLGVLVLTGFDKYLEALAVNVVPDWVFSL
ncbi:MAG: sulfite exporter TauE/SafE family protein [Gemmatimonadota bacterium]|nr:sulfite exporter TauE/SafE family protein [Gemmatimonadota bacterium]